MKSHIMTPVFGVFFLCSSITVAIWHYCVPYNAEEPIDGCVSNCLETEDICKVDYWQGYYCQFSLAANECNLNSRETTVTRKTHPCHQGSSYCVCDQSYVESSEQLTLTKPNAACSGVQ